MKLRFALPLAAALSMSLALSGAAHGAYPSSIASTGDSITRAFNDCWFPYVDCPSASWTTGTSSYSHYRRIQGANPAITGRSYNQAVSGADMADLYGQVQGAIGRRAEYVTILMGANDVCASSEAGMTDVGVFRAQFDAAMASLTSGLPSSRVFVSSIPTSTNCSPSTATTWARTLSGRSRESASRCSRTRSRTSRATWRGARESASGTSTTTPSSRRSVRCTSSAASTGTRSSTPLSSGAT